MAEFDVFVGNHAIINLEIYDLWLRGLTPEEAADRFLSNEESFRSGSGTRDAGSIQGPRSKSSQGSSFRGSTALGSSMASFVLADVYDHYRTLAVLERFLQNPPNLVEQLNFQLTAQTQALLIRKYYEYDESVFREFAGKKLSMRSRNNLDDASDRLNVRTKSCRRQFDNVKRILKLVEDMDGSLVDNIRSSFLLPTDLASQYACMVFVINNRFELTGKRRLNYVTFADIVFCAREMMTRWTGAADDGDADFDREFLVDLRELKTMGDRESLEEHKGLVMAALRTKTEERALADLEANFKNYSRALIHIAYGLNHGKEARDLFVDLVEKIVEPAKNARWIYADFARFLKTYAETACSVGVIDGNNKLTSVLERYLTTVIACLLRLFHN